MADRSRLVRMKITNLGCVGPEGLTVTLDEILCLVGPNNTGKSTILRAYELAAGGPASRPQILGHGMAHEIGHLLLKVIGHSPSGIMRARWDREALRQVARGDLLFTPQETALIRAEVRERVSQQGYTRQ